MPNDHDSADVKIQLSRDQALVLSDWISRRMHEKEFAAVVDDRAVWSALFRIAGALDAELWEIFSPEYANMLDQARERLNPGLGDFGLPDAP